MKKQLKLILISIGIFMIPIFANAQNICLYNPNTVPKVRIYDLNNLDVFWHDTVTITVVQYNSSTYAQNYVTSGLLNIVNCGFTPVATYTPTLTFTCNPASTPACGNQFTSTFTPTITQTSINVNVTNLTAVPVTVVNPGGGSSFGGGVYPTNTFSVISNQGTSPWLISFGTPTFTPTPTFTGSATPTPTSTTNIGNVSVVNQFTPIPYPTAAPTAFFNLPFSGPTIYRETSNSGNTQILNGSFSYNTMSVYFPPAGAYSNSLQFEALLAGGGTTMIGWSDVNQQFEFRPQAGATDVVVYDISGYSNIYLQWFSAPTTVAVSFSYGANNSTGLQQQNNSYFSNLKSLIAPTPTISVNSFIQNWPTPNQTTPIAVSIVGGGGGSSSVTISGNTLPSSSPIPVTVVNPGGGSSFGGGVYPTNTFSVISNQGTSPWLISFGTPTFTPTPTFTGSATPTPTSTNTPLSVYVTNVPTVEVIANASLTPQINVNVVNQNTAVPVATVQEIIQFGTQTPTVTPGVFNQSVSIAIAQNASVTVTLTSAWTSFSFTTNTSGSNTLSLSGSTDNMAHSAYYTIPVIFWNQGFVQNLSAGENLPTVGNLLWFKCTGLTNVVFSNDNITNVPITLVGNFSVSDVTNPYAIATIMAETPVPQFTQMPYPTQGAVPVYPTGTWAINIGNPVTVILPTNTFTPTPTFTGSATPTPTSTNTPLSVYVTNIPTVHVIANASATPQINVNSFIQNPIPQFTQLPYATQGAVAVYPTGTWSVNIGNAVTVILPTNTFTPTATFTGSATPTPTPTNTPLVVYVTNIPTVQVVANASLTPQINMNSFIQNAVAVYPTGTWPVGSGGGGSAPTVFPTVYVVANTSPTPQFNENAFIQGPVTIVLPTNTFTPTPTFTGSATPTPTSTNTPLSVYVTNIPTVQVIANASLTPQINVNVVNQNTPVPQFTQLPIPTAISTPIVESINSTFFGPLDTWTRATIGTYNGTVATPVATAQAGQKVDVETTITNVGNAYGGFEIFAGAVSVQYQLAPQQFRTIDYLDNVGNIAVSFAISAVNGLSTTGVTIIADDTKFRKHP